MNFELICDVFMTLAAVTGLLISLFGYIEKPARSRLYITAFFLAHILSDYYWTIYRIIISEYPEVSELMAYFGWSLGFIFLILAVRKMQDPEVKKFFHPLIFLPVPFTVCLFMLYISFGGIINNIIQVGATTITACICLQTVLYHVKHKGEKRFPAFHLVVFLYIVSEYGMWTASCFEWPDQPFSFYLTFNIISSILMVIISLTHRNASDARLLSAKNYYDHRLHLLLQLLSAFIIIGGGIGGFILASWMKSIIAASAEGSDAYQFIAVILFFISVMIVILIAALLFIIALRQENVERIKAPGEMAKTRRYGFIFTVLITLTLMIFSIVYSSGLIREASVNNVYNSGEDRANIVATDLGNYLLDTYSTLQVTADSIDYLIETGAPDKEIRDYIFYQTASRKQTFDENFTGIYSYIDNIYTDGSGWIAPPDFKPTERIWYKQAVEAKGKIIMLSPYLDAQTGEMVITVCRLLKKGKDSRSTSENVVALDIIANYIQETTENINISGKGYGMTINNDGLFVAHPDKSLIGTPAAEVLGQETMDAILKKNKGTLDVKVNGEDYTFFVSPVLEQMHVVVAISDDQLFSDVNSQLMVSILVSIIIFMLISVFYVLGYKNEQMHNRKMAEMQEGIRKQEYEAQILKLEKQSADEANKAKSSFLADMSHEIRTPINAILGMNEMILRESESDNIQEYSHNIEASGKNLLQLINSILDFSKIEEGKMEIIPVSYRTADLVTYLINSISERAHSKDLAFNADIDPGIPSGLFGDDSRISQVVVNLLTNAVKYTHEGSVKLTMKEKERKDGSILLYVEVKDTGIGIRENDMERLFESFERLDKVRNRNIEGTGLGMSITTNLLSLMNSELKVESTYGKGSAFYFELWQKIEDETPLGDYNESAQRNGSVHNEKDHLYAPDAHILIVDDTKMNLTVAVKLLKRTAINVTT
ncbi:MAG: hypothetical protein IK054_04260, partial [Lachnospiraceae bacterium]|nr:hypothetical protein [Lachnospiraceae bacterium]